MLDFDARPSIRQVQRGYDLRCKELDPPQLDFDNCVKRLEHSFLQMITPYSGFEFIDFQHPMLRDMLLSQLREDEVARRRYIQLASPVGLSNLIGSMASSLREEKEDNHVLLPKNEEELLILLERLAEVSSGVLLPSEWHAILSATERLIPRDSSKRKLAPTEIDLHSFAKSWAGKVVEAVVQAFKCKETFERNQQYELKEWTVLLEVFYDLAIYMVPPPCPEYLPSLVKDLESVDPGDGIAFANLIQNSEPLIIKQSLPQRLLIEWDHYIRNKLVELIVTGEGLPTSEEEYYPDVEYY